MDRSAVPRVSVGMPVYNGARYIAQAIDSILAQTFSDWELIISDNASNDATGQICQSYVSRDDRVRYYRNEWNRGAAWNHNRVVQLARGEFFRWQSHDDYCDETFLEKCLAVILSDPDAVLCYPQFVRIDEEGRRLGVKSSRVLGSASAPERFHSLIHRRDSCEEIYGITRTSIIRQTTLIGPYSCSDDIFLAELVLRGEFREVPEPLFFYRIHSAQSTKAYPSRTERMAWFNPFASQRLSMPFARLLVSYITLVWRSPLSWRERTQCYRSLIGWVALFRDWFTEDLHELKASLIQTPSMRWFKQHALWARPLWSRLKSLRGSLRRPQSARARDRAARRQELESWQLTRED